ncbi:hypothetical protein BZG73_15670 [Salinivibrio siamensis]|uniref:DUF4760 domain-containing protein n=1 Tax=Salinivibrio siamensis TaxID=414286 RepID=A0ABX3K4V9_9GAMM|nr:hypothetical protein [Salinivibrio siamensis]OOE78951.1 hypothetical protein BZG73_15670 [Salinivibrio siamensis]
MDISSALIPLLSAFFGAAFTFWGQRKLLEQRVSLEFNVKQAERFEEACKLELGKLEEKIEEAHAIASELGWEFSPTVLNIDWEAGMSLNEYDLKYKALLDKCSRLQVLVDLYVPHLSEDVNKVSGNMNIYWGNFRNVLSKTHQGVLPNELGSVFDTALKYSRLIPDQTYSLKHGLSDFYRSKSFRNEC